MNIQNDNELQIYDEVYEKFNSSSNLLYVLLNKEEKDNIFYKDKLKVFKYLFNKGKEDDKYKIYLENEFLESLLHEFQNKEIVCDINKEDFTNEEYEYLLNIINDKFKSYLNVAKYRRMNANEDIIVDKDIVITSLNENNIKEFENHLTEYFSNSNNVKDYENLFLCTYKKKRKLFYQKEDLRLYFLIQNNDKTNILFNKYDGFLGCIFFDFDSNDSLSMSYFIFKEFRNKHIAFKACSTLINYIFNGKIKGYIHKPRIVEDKIDYYENIKYITLTTDQENTPSIKLAKKLEFCLTAFIHDYSLINNEFHDAFILTLFKEKTKEKETKEIIKSLL